MTDFVTYHGSETLENTFRRSGGDEFGFRIPENLIERLELADREQQGWQHDGWLFRHGHSKRTPVSSSGSPGKRCATPITKPRSRSSRHGRGTASPANVDDDGAPPGRV